MPRINPSEQYPIASQSHRNEIIFYLWNHANMVRSTFMRCFRWLCICVCACICVSCKLQRLHCNAVQSTDVRNYSALGVSSWATDKQSSRNEFLIKYSYAIYLNAFSLKCNVYVTSIWVLGVITVWLLRCLSECGRESMFCTSCCHHLCHHFDGHCCKCVSIYTLGLRLSMPNIQNEILIGFVTCPPMATASIWHISSHEYASSKNKSIAARGQCRAKHKNVDIWYFVWIQLRSRSFARTQTHKKSIQFLVNIHKSFANTPSRLVSHLIQNGFG